jgi:hypothetical protein
MSHAAVAIGIAVWVVLALVALALARTAGEADRDSDEIFARWQASRHFTPELDFTLDFAHQPTKDKHAPVLHERLR